MFSDANDNIIIINAFRETTTTNGRCLSVVYTPYKRTKGGEGARLILNY